MKKLILFAFMTFAGTSLLAQDSTNRLRNPRNDRKEERRQRINAIIKQEEEGNLSFHKQTAVGLQLRTNGYGAFLEIGRRRSPRFSNLYLIELSEIKERKEEKIGGAENFFSNSYVFGKRNNFYQLKLGFGQQYILGQKGNKNGVAVTANVTAGLSAGLLKPYFLDIVDSTNTQKTVSYESDPFYFLDRGSIIGSSGFTKGWNELKIRPGAFVRSALRFDFGRYNERIQALEIGLSVDAYAQKIPLLALNEDRRFFYQGHIAFVFGSRK